MTREEHRNIMAFIERTMRPRDEAAAEPPAEPVDVEADAIIRALFVRNPEAAYRVTRLAMAQQDELARLRGELVDARARLQKSWLARLLNRDEAREREPEIRLLPQNARGR